MGKKDITLQDFLGDPYIFADLFNGCCFGGEQVIHAEELSPLDSVQCTASHRQPYWRWRTRSIRITVWQSDACVTMRTNMNAR